MSAYYWWNTLVSVVPMERVTWDFFQAEFRRKYISQRFIDSKRKEFLELKQGRMTVSEHERKFVRLSRYARECVSSEATMSRRFEEGLNEETKFLVGILEINEFVVLVERACKAEELGKEKRKADFEARDFHKRSSGKFRQTSTKKFKNDKRPPVSSRATSIASVGNTRPNKPSVNSVADGILVNVGENLITALATSVVRRIILFGIARRQLKSIMFRVQDRAVLQLEGDCLVTWDVGVALREGLEIRLFDQRPGCQLEPMPVVPERRLHLQMSSPVIALNDLGSTHSYVCETLVSNKTLPVESTEFVLQVSNPLG
ncbi:E3 ubiquitin-protein ligase RBBP6 [Gossypium australe]|uniref:E3 ubiquitin-protein ligase RBBP6 n=1 Tax=Gossypium australe TaxID=47621 RepID=A0A5B6VV42_9ROSI|nr:E3 ubiquitin-protein ligase RBBP6 [Gossypium australe]